MDRFFKMVLAITLFCLILCIAQLARIEFGYEISNFLDKSVIALNPRQVARQYILAIKKKDYKTAYSYLTPDTKEIFSLPDFISMNKIWTEMDEDSAKIHWQGVFVGMQIYQDPGSWAYLLVKTNGKWRIVIRSKGTPTFPYVKEYFCGNSECEY